MAESVQHQMLSAVTEGHQHSHSTINETVKNKDNNSSRSPAASTNARRGRGRGRSPKKACGVPVKFTTKNSNNSKDSKNQNIKEKISQDSSTNKITIQTDSGTAGGGSSTRTRHQTNSPTTRLNRKRTLNKHKSSELLGSTESLNSQNKEKRSRFTSKSPSSVRNTSNCTEDCIASRTRSKTRPLAIEEEAVLRPSTKSDNKIDNKSQESLHNTEPVIQTAVEGGQQEKRKNLLSYYRKTRGGNSNRDSAVTRKLRWSPPKETVNKKIPLEVNLNTSTNTASDPRLNSKTVKKQGKSVVKGGQKNTEKTKSQTASRKATTKVDKNQRNNHLATNSSLATTTNIAGRNLRSVAAVRSSDTGVVASGSSNSDFPVVPSPTGQSSSSGSSYTYTVSLGSSGAVPKKRQKVGDYFETFYTSSSASGSPAFDFENPRTLNYSQSGSGVGYQSTSNVRTNGNSHLVGASSASTTTTTGYSKAPNLGARLARGGGAGRDAPQQQQQVHHNQQPQQQLYQQPQQQQHSLHQPQDQLQQLNYHRVQIGATGGFSATDPLQYQQQLQQQQQQSSSSHSLRRSSRGKTGSCVSSSTAQGSGSSVTASLSSTTVASSSLAAQHHQQQLQQATSSRASAAGSHFHQSIHHRSTQGAVSNHLHPLSHSQFSHNQSTKNTSSNNSASVKHYEATGPSTSTQAASAATGTTLNQHPQLGNDGGRNQSGQESSSLAANSSVKQHKASLVPPANSSVGGIDVTSLHLGTPQSSGTAASSGGSQTTPLSGSAASASGGGAHPDSESDDSEVGRLQALLEARGLPPHLFGALGPRMHHILHRTIGASSTSKAQQLLQGLQSHDESQQLQAAIEMCQMLVMGNEDTLAGFPTKQVVPALINLLRMEHNFDIMNNACRALAYMLEALPRSSATVVDAVPTFLDKLQVIQCMDVAEQSLTALEILSRRHNKAILQANGVSACLTYLDFFSINAQRAALAITANCCLNLHPEEFHFVCESLPLLARLLSQQDKKCVESVCTAFYRLVESFQHDPQKLQEIVSKELLKNCQQLLVVTPSVLNSGTFTNVVRMLSVMCSNCPDLAISLLKSDIAATLLYLLTGSAEPSHSVDVELVSRSPSELYEITCLIGELMPRLPTDGIFSVDALLERPNSGTTDACQWQWRDDRGMWHSYSAIDSRMIEAAHMNSDDEISFSTLGRTYTIDFHSMQQINEDTGTTRPVQRKINPSFLASIVNGQDLSMGAIANPGNDPETKLTIRDARIACLNEERGLAAEFIKNLFSVLYEVYSSSAGPAVRYKCLRALLRMVYYASPELLKDVLKNQIVSSHIAGMMASNDLRIVVGALQMAEILIQKLPEVFGTHFRREGVIHQITQLADPNNPICAQPSPKAPSGGALSAPASATGLQTNPFDFDTSTPSSSKGHGSHVKNLCHAMNVLNSKMTISMPSTSAASLQMPSTSSSTLAISLTTTPSSPIATEVPQQAMASSLPNNGNFLIYSTAADPCHYNHYGHHHHVPPPHYQTHVEMMASTPPPISNVPDSQSSIPPSTSAGNATTALQSKMTDILKRKVPPKRKSQSSGRSKSRQEESTVQDLINRATSMGSGSSGRNTPSSSGLRSRFGGTSSSNLATGTSSGSSSKTSFLASLNPARWGRQGSHHSSFTKENSSSGSSANTSNNLGKSSSNANLIAAGNREKARQWIRDQAISFINRYTEQEISKTLQQPAASILSRLTAVIQKLEGNADDCLEALQELKTILIESDISPFEVNHSGLIKAMLTFMSSEHGMVHRDDRLRSFLHVFAGLPSQANTITGNSLPMLKSAPFSAFVAKLNGCVTQLEQFPVKVHDFPAGPGGRSNTSALKFFNTHQLKCNLQRHPECTNLRQWKGGTVKIDPLALVQAIERYLVVRGYGGIRVDSEEDSEEDMDDNVAAVVMSQSGFKHKLQFLIGEHVLPYNMTVYQAVKQFSPLVNDQSETDTESETPIGNASVWAQQHTIFYRPIEEENAASSSGASGGSTSKVTASSILTKKSGKSSSSKLIRKKTEFWHEGNVPQISSPLLPFLASSLPTDLVTVQDASLDALCMLRIINALNRHWEFLYGHVYHEHIIAQTEFIHSKITAKANRQLQDPLVLMTGNLPQWLQQIATACPFLFPFETRHLLFYAITFDRDRALQRLLDTAPDLNSSDTTERVTPRLDRRKRAISREDILKQAEHIIQDFGHSKALLEIQYENEVGTGLGPTLEFYALVSAELQRCDLGLWNGSDSYKQNSSTIVDIVKSGLTQIDDNNDSSANNRHHHKQQTQPAVHQTHHSSSTGGVVAANNSLNTQSTVDQGSYISHENALNMIIEHSDTTTTASTTATNTNALMVVRESVAENEAQNQEFRLNYESQISTVGNPLPPAPVVHPVAVTYVSAPHGLFPIPLGKAAKLSQISRLKTKFKFLGKLMAKAVMDSRMLDLPFSIPFYRWLLNEETGLGLTELARVAPEVQVTLVRLQDRVRQRDSIQSDSSFDAMEKTEKIELLDLDGCPIADLGLDFVLPGHANIELRRGGRDIPVTIHNLHQYIALVTHWFLFEGAQRQFEALREGFDTVFPSARLRMFYPEELENVFCGSGTSSYQRWDSRMLHECCRTDHGFSQDSEAIQFLYEILSSYNRDEQRLFLQFVTGSPRLPTGGFKTLSPPLTIVRKTLDLNQNPDDYLPSVMTCVNYLKLPEYTNREVMRAKLRVAASEGSMSFHLS